MVTVSDSSHQIGLATLEFDTGEKLRMFDGVELLPNGWVKVIGDEGDTKYYSPNVVIGVHPHDE